MNYCALTCDINLSRQIDNRNQLQMDVQKALENANQSFAEDIVVPFSITLGDEWQGLTQNLCATYQIILHFMELLPDISVCYGIGVGPIATGIQKRSAEMDGQAFHRSREALEQGKKKDAEIVLRSGDGDFDAWVNGYLRLLQVIRQGWTARQRQKIMLYRQLETQRAVAQKIGVSQADINQALKAGHGKIYLECEQILLEKLIKVK